MTWTLRPGIDALPHIGPGPLTDEAYEAAEAAYMRSHFGAAEVPADAQRPRDTGLYLHTAEESDGKKPRKAAADAGEEITP